ncbi:hypothetical protein OG883_40505 [Streptomyces sp. NBC_01142]|uniref:hypothetical protein n=1 Tax=Streptomyces sp. NBC_01142 TaxID=2975865 RepID=UPI0022520E31|nr:hypothetical protein [Streptomyces sp. NBC_01142]MCX4825967.1 hypothetical protein [Streptomyces sp. NBC_01142]
MAEKMRHMHWELIGTGSATWRWSVAGEDLEVHTTYLGDALKSILQSARDLQIGSRSSFAVFESEPSGTRVFFSGAEDEVYVQIVYFDDLQSMDNRWAGGQPRWAGRVSTSGFVDNVRSMAEQLLSEVGESGYQKAWGYPFPMHELQALR